MVLEYCPGTALSRLLREQGRFEIDMAVDIVLQLAQGLGAAHELGIVHRDLKPENVILTETRPGRFHARLLDFGIAKRIDDDGPKLTQAGMVFGTPEYMAPEQARGRAVDGRSDLYSLGTVFYELLTGTPPFSSVDKLQVMHRQANEPPEAPSDRVIDVEIPAEIEAVVMRCLEKEPEDRYQTAAELLRALDSTSADKPANESVLAETAESVVVSTDSYGGTLEPGVPEGFEMAAPIQPRTSDNLVLEMDVELGNPRMQRPKHHPSMRSMVIAVLIFCGAITLTVLRNHRGPEEAASTVKGPTPISAPTAPDVKTPRVTPAVRVVKVPAADAKSNPDSTVSKATPGPSRPPANSKSEAPGTPSTDAQKPEIDPEEQRIAAEKKAAKKRKRTIARAKKAFGAGRLTRAKRLLQPLLSANPDDPVAKRLVGRVDGIKKALVAGKKALARHDCVGALKVLEPVMKTAPASLGLSKMVDDCRQALPPRQL
jgi:serine/threonine-protein kinase